MPSGIYIAAAGANARQKQVDVLANNLANSTTAGYMAQRTAFSLILDKENQLQTSSVEVEGNGVSLTPGTIIDTGNEKDLALGRNSFFMIDNGENEPLLVRCASLEADEKGQLRNQQGHLIAGSTGAITIDLTVPFEVDESGGVIQEGTEVAKLKVVTVADPSFLEPMGAATYRTNEQSGEPVEIESKVLSGHLEGSNVNPVESMVELIELQRDFQTLIRAVQSYKEADERLIGAIAKG